MKAYEIQADFGVDKLALVERAEPVPGTGQVLLQMNAWSLNRRDLLMVTGIYNPKLRRPVIPVSDGVGTVIAVGPDVTRVKVGDRVAGAFMQSWIDGPLTDADSRSALGGAIDGLLAERVVLHEDGVVQLPAHLTNEEAATLPCAAVTAWHALVTEGRIKAGDVVLVQGTGGVSIFALQFARLHGARVIATSSSDAKLARLRELDASDTINYRATPAWEERVRELTGSVGVDHVVEVGGAGTMSQSLRAVRAGGQVSCIGVLSGVGGEFNPLPILMRGIRLQGVFVGSRAMFESMNRAIDLAKLRPVVDRVFPFAQAREALHYLESGAHFGKIVLRAE
jgi:NADPH:quinone reductase-like Zn-dependent oxidoreductase